MILSKRIRIKSNSQQQQSQSGVLKELVAILLDRENRYLDTVGNASDLFAFGLRLRLRLRLEPCGRHSR